MLELALAAVQGALALDDTNPLSHRILGVVYLCQKQYEQAIAEVKRAIALDPEEAESYALLAQMLSRMGRMEEAVAMVEQALRRKPLMTDGHLFHIGVTYYLTGKLDEGNRPQSCDRLLVEPQERFPSCVLYGQAQRRDLQWQVLKYEG